MLARRCPRRASRATRLPELAEVLCEFLAGSSPVGFDAVAKLDHVTLEVELVLLEPRNVEFFARCSALELAVDVLVVVADDPKQCQWPLKLFSSGNAYLVMMPVVLNPSVLWVTKNMPLSLIGP